MSEPDMDAPVTRRELHEALGTWGGALKAELKTELKAEIIGEVKVLIEASEGRVIAELRAQVRAIEEQRAFARSTNPIETCRQG